MRIATATIFFWGELLFLFRYNLDAHNSHTPHSHHMYTYAKKRLGGTRVYRGISGIISENKMGSLGFESDGRSTRLFYHWTYNDLQWPCSVMQESLCWAQLKRYVHWAWQQGLIGPLSARQETPDLGQSRRQLTSFRPSRLVPLCRRRRWVPLHCAICADFFLRCWSCALEWIDLSEDQNIPVYRVCILARYLFQVFASDPFQFQDFETGRIWVPWRA